MAHPPYLPTWRAASNQGVRSARGYQQWKRPCENVGYFVRTAAAGATIEWFDKDTRLAPNKQALISPNAKNSPTDHFDASALED